MSRCNPAFTVFYSLLPESQGLKPQSVVSLSGRAKAVPCYTNPFLASLFQGGHGGAALFHHLARNLKLFQFLLARQVEHEVEHQFFQNHAQAAGAHLARHGLAGNGAQRFIAELQANVFELEQALVLLDDGIFGAREDLDQREFIEIFEHTDDWQAADEFRDQPELDQVFRLDFAEQLEVALPGDGRVFFFGLFAAAETQRLFADAPADNLFQTDECTAADEKNVGGIDGSEFLVWMFTTALRRNVGNCSFENLEQGLLHAFAGNIASDRWVFVLAADLVDFVDVDDAGLSAAYIPLGGLQ